MVRVSQYESVDSLEQKVTLSHWEDGGGFAGEEFAVSADFVGFGIDFHVGHGIIQLHISFGELANIGNGDGAFL